MVSVCFPSGCVLSRTYFRHTQECLLLRIEVFRRVILSRKGKVKNAGRLPALRGGKCNGDIDGKVKSPTRNGGAWGTQTQSLRPRDFKFEISDLRDGENRRGIPRRTAARNNDIT